MLFCFQAYEKCFQNLHYMERYEDHTIAHAIQAKYEKTKVNPHTHMLGNKIYPLYHLFYDRTSLTRSLPVCILRSTSGLGR
jgi:hypothetical protein